MKWSEVQKAKHIEFNKTLFLKDEKEFYTGKLVEKKQTKEGLIHTFEVAVFPNEKWDPVYIDTITHFIVPK